MFGELLKYSWPNSPINLSDTSKLKNVIYVLYAYLEENWRAVITRELKLEDMNVTSVLY